MTRRLTFNKAAEYHQTNWRRKHRLLLGKWGWQNRVTREHILPAGSWIRGIWQPIRSNLEQYIASSQIQAHLGKHNLKSSWAQCANIFFPFRLDRMMASVLQDFLNQRLGLSITSIEGVELEYCPPGNLHPKRLLGEVGGRRGAGQTSPDVAILFGCEDGKSGIYLIENKYTEDDFSNCPAARKTLDKEHSQRGLPGNPDPGRCHQVIDVAANPEALCHQAVWGRKYWDLLKDHIDRQALGACNVCPALSGGYQLFRQQALAQGLANARLFDYVISGVAYDARNEALVTCLRRTGIAHIASDWDRLFETDVRYHCFTHQDFIAFASQERVKRSEKWIEYIRDRYGYE